MEKESISVIEEQVITRIFKVKAGSQFLKLSYEDATNLYEQLREKFEFADKKTTPAKAKIFEHDGKKFHKFDDMLVPLGYKPLDVRKSLSRDGTSVHYYHYFKANKEFGFIIKNGTTTRFSRLGNIEDKTSPLRRVLDISPKNKSFNKSHYKRNKVTINNQTVKAVADILVIEGYLEEVRDASSKIISYRVTDKVKELESITVLNR